MSNLQRAIEIAVEAHRNQVGKGGRPYILHPLRLMFQMKSEVERIIAVLHDTVEDTPVSLEQLRAEGFGEEVIDAIDRVSRREGESWESFIDRALHNRLARRVKIADLEDNLDVRRLRGIEDDDLRRTRRYHAAWMKLKAVEDAADGSTESEA